MDRGEVASAEMGKVLGILSLCEDEWVSTEKVALMLDNLTVEELDRMQPVPRDRVMVHARMRLIQLRDRGLVVQGKGVVKDRRRDRYIDGWHVKEESE